MFAVPADLNTFAVERQARALQAREVARLTRTAAKFLGPLFAPLNDFLARRRIIAELSALDDRMLDDIGLARFEIAERIHSIDLDPNSFSHAADRHLGTPGELAAPANQAGPEGLRRVA